MYSCSEVTRWIATDEYRSAGFLKRVGIALHLVMCRHCSRYLKQLQALAKSLRALVNDIEVSASEIDAARTRITAQILNKG